MTLLRDVSPPRGLFQGNNFMTPRVLAYYKLRKGYAELSEGEGMSRQPIFGVTVRPEPKGVRLSKLFQSRAEAERYIAEMS